MPPGMPQCDYSFTVPMYRTMSVVPPPTTPPSPWPQKSNHRQCRHRHGRICDSWRVGRHSAVRRSTHTAPTAGTYLAAKKNKQPYLTPVLAGRATIRGATVAGSEQPNIAAWGGRSIAPTLGSREFHSGRQHYHRHSATTCPPSSLSPDTPGAAHPFVSCRLNHSHPHSIQVATNHHGKQAIHHTVVRRVAGKRRWRDAGAVRN
jgi:hypothetical protein